jgi:hypothetical protein
MVSRLTQRRRTGDRCCMRLEPGCPRCPASVTGTGTAWVCPTHETIVPLWRATEAGYDAFTDHLALSRPLPTWLPWPLPDGWHVTDFGCVGVEGGTPQAAYATCSGPSALDGVVELTVVTEEPGVGLGARCGGVVHTDPGREAGVGTAPIRLRVGSASVPLWLISTDEVPEALDRAVLAGEAQGRWLWVVLRPASAALLLHDLGRLDDVSELGPQLLTLPFGPAPSAW